jgi:hypothetical protein
LRLAVNLRVLRRKLAGLPNLDHIANRDIPDSVSIVFDPFRFVLLRSAALAIFRARSV